MKFKVGERVVFITANGVGHSLARFGDGGIVLYISDDLVTVQTDRGPIISAFESRFIDEAQAAASFQTKPVTEDGVLVKLEQLIEAQKAEIATHKAAYREAQRKLSNMQAAKVLVEGL